MKQRAAVFSLFIPYYDSTKSEKNTTAQSVLAKNTSIGFTVKIGFKFFFLGNCLAI